MSGEKRWRFRLSIDLTKIGTHTSGLCLAAFGQNRERADGDAWTHFTAEVKFGCA